MKVSKYRKALAIYSLVFFFFFLIFAEVLLRTSVSFLELPLFIERMADREACLQINPDFLERYYGATEVYPRLQPAMFRQTKDTGTIRIAFLGESGFSGFPYRFTASVPGMVRHQLSTRYPDRKFEIINLSGGINTTIAKHLAPTLRDLHPDLVILSLGSNEFNGPNGAETNVFSRMLSGAALQANRLRIVALARYWRKMIHGTDSDEIKLTADAQLPVESPDAVPASTIDRLVDQYGDNIEAIVAELQEANIPVIAAVPVTNPEVSFPYGYQTGGNDTVDARRRFRSALADVCSGKHIPLVRLDTLADAGAEGQAEPSLNFWDHLHVRPSFRPSVAAALSEAVCAQLPVLYTQPNRSADSWNAPVIPWVELARGDIIMNTLEARISRIVSHKTPVAVTAGDETQQRLAQDAYEERISWEEACFESAFAFSQAGDQMQAEICYRSVLEEFPTHWFAHFSLGNLLAATKRPQEAELHFLAAIRGNPSLPQPRNALGMLYISLRRFADAEEQFTKALEMMPGPGGKQKAQAYYGLAEAAFRRKNMAETERFIGLALEIDPSHEGAASLQKKMRGK